MNEYLQRLYGMIRPQSVQQAATSPLTSPQLGMLNRVLGLTTGQAETALQRMPEQLAQSQAMLEGYTPGQPIDPKLLDQFMNLATMAPMGMTQAAKSVIQPARSLADEYTSLQTKVNQLDEKIRSGEFSIKDVNERAKSINRLEELNTTAYQQTQPAIQNQPQGLLDTSYRGFHTAPNREFGAQLFELNKIYPDDIYSPNAARFYGHFGGGSKIDQKSAQIIRSFRGKPDADVTIYRAVPKDEKIKNINAGDWVTINKDYAKDHGESVLRGEYKILEKKVKAKDIWTNADSIHEYGYDPF